MMANEFKTKEKDGAPERVRTSDLWFRRETAENSKPLLWYHLAGNSAI
jgi:hypothetical protein